MGSGSSQIMPDMEQIIHDKNKAITESIKEKMEGKQISPQLIKIALNTKLLTFMDLEVRRDFSSALSVSHGDLGKRAIIMKISKFIAQKMDVIISPFFFGQEILTILMENGFLRIAECETMTREIERLKVELDFESLTEENVNKIIKLFVTDYYGFNYKKKTKTLYSKDEYDQLKRLLRSIPDKQIGKKLIRILSIGSAETGMMKSSKFFGIVSKIPFHGYCYGGSKKLGKKILRYCQKMGVEFSVLREIVITKEDYESKWDDYLRKMINNALKETQDP